MYLIAVVIVEEFSKGVPLKRPLKHLVVRVISRRPDRCRVFPQGEKSGRFFEPSHSTIRCCTSEEERKRKKEDTRASSPQHPPTQRHKYQILLLLKENHTSAPLRPPSHTCRSRCKGLTSKPLPFSLSSHRKNSPDYSYYYPAL